MSELVLSRAHDVAVDHAIAKVGRPLGTICVLTREMAGGWAIEVHDRAGLLEDFDRLAREGQDAEERAIWADLAAEVRARPLHCPEVIFFRDGDVRLRFACPINARGGSA